MAEEREQYVTVRMTARGREKLRRLAKLNRRTMAQQLEWLIDREWQAVKAEPAPATAEEPLAK